MDRLLVDCNTIVEMSFLFFFCVLFLLIRALNCESSAVYTAKQRLSLYRVFVSDWNCLAFCYISKHGIDLFLISLTL